MSERLFCLLHKSCDHINTISALNKIYKAILDATHDQTPFEYPKILLNSIFIFLCMSNNVANSVTLCYSSMVVSKSKLVLRINNTVFFNKLQHSSQKYFYNILESKLIGQYDLISFSEFLGFNTIIISAHFHCV